MGQAQPLPRVVFVEVQQSGAALRINHRAVNASKLEAELSSVSNLRPNAILQLTSARDLSCDEIEELGNRLDAAFNCAKNYCYLERK